jgi:oligopeptide/dipeptide ABC transporter ATP-binding protein
VTATVLDIRNLCARFRTGGAAVEVVRGVDLAIGEGEVLGIIGESGSGKTVTGLSILRLLPANAEVSADVLSFRGSPLLTLTDEAFRALRGTHLAMIFQNPAGSFNPAKTIGWHLARTAERAQTRLPREGVAPRAGVAPHAGTPPPKQHAERRLAEVGIPNPARVLTLYPHQLSGGMLQRALIAMVLVLEPDLIIADEPTTNLDNIVERQIINLLHALRTRTNAAMIFITHDMSIAAGLCDRIAVMYAGEIVESGPAATVFAAPRHPYTQGLIDTALQLERGVERLREIPGEMPGITGLHEGCVFAPRCGKATDACWQARPAVTQLSPVHAVRCIHHG